MSCHNFYLEKTWGCFCFLLVWAQSAHIKSIMGAIGPVSKTLNMLVCSTRSRSFFSLLFGGSLGGGGVIYPPNNYMPNGIFVECLVAHIIKFFWNGYIYIFYINFHSNCPGLIVRGSVGKALLALSQFCRFNGKTIKWRLKITVLFLYADVIYKVSITIIFIFINYIPPIHPFQHKMPRSLRT